MKIDPIRGRSGIVYTGPKLYGFPFSYKVIKIAAGFLVSFLWLKLNTVRVCPILYCTFSETEFETKRRSNTIAINF